MKVCKFLSIVAFITVLCLVYVWQQTEIFRLAYLAQKKQSFFQDLLDKNALLRYNIEKSASLIHLGNKVSKIGDFEMPETFRLVKLAAKKGNPGKSARLAAGKENILSRLFSIKRQAEAKTTNP